MAPYGRRGGVDGEAAEAPRKRASGDFIAGPGSMERGQAAGPRGAARARAAASSAALLPPNAAEPAGFDGDAEAGVASSSSSSDSLEAERTPPSPVWSSGVAFYPPSRKYWRIGGKWYDFAGFLDKHPGGATVLQLARDRFEDCTFVFEAHHHDYRRVRAIIRKYEVSEALVHADGGIRRRPSRRAAALPAHHDAALDAGSVAQLLGHEAFFSVLRTRVAAYLRSVGHPDGGPTPRCVALFWVVFAAWAMAYACTWQTGSVAVALVWGLLSTYLGAFGHNWVHQPRYKLWAYLSLDVIGFSSDGWFREHLLQHHMYTNTPWDNHFKATDPFLVTDPTVHRNFLQRCIFPYLNPLILCFGLYGNYANHCVELAKGNEVISPAKLMLPLQYAVLVARWGWLHGFLLHFSACGLLSVYYLSIALMNHNAEHCTDVRARNSSCDWAVAQLHSSADWAVGSSFLGAGRFLWLNYHTVHHLFPVVDMSHHPGIQAILMRTCDEFEINYCAGEPLTIYREMINSFANPLSLMQEIVVYAGGL